MENELDREGFYKQLGMCKSKNEIESLIDKIDDENLHVCILDKYNQILQFNTSNDEQELVKDIIKILEFTYLNFYKGKTEK